MTEADGTTPMFQRTIDRHESIPDGYKLYRQLLAQQPDHSVSIVTTGFVTCLAQLLQSGADEYSVLNGVELVRRKVKCIYMQGGVFDKAEEPDYNFLQGITFAQTFFDLWPKDVDMVFSPMEVGQTVEYTPEQVIADVSWTDRHPIKQVYMTCDCNTGQRMWDPMCVIQAIEGDSLFTLSERFTINITQEAYTVFTPTPAGNARKRALPEARRCPVGRHDAGENQNDEQNEIEGVPIGKNRKPPWNLGLHRGFCLICLLGHPTGTF